MMDIIALGYKILNPAMNRLLRSPLHFIVSYRIMAIEYIGRKSGKVYSMPVNYFIENDTVYSFTTGKWWKNFIEGQKVTLRIAGKDQAAHGISEYEDKEKIKEAMHRYFQKAPYDARYYDVSLSKDNIPNAIDLERAVSNVAMVKFQLNLKNA